MKATITGTWRDAQPKLVPDHEADEIVVEHMTAEQFAAEMGAIYSQYVERYWLGKHLVKLCVTFETE